MPELPGPVSRPSKPRACGPFGSNPTVMRLTCFVVFWMVIFWVHSLYSGSGGFSTRLLMGTESEGHSHRPSTSTISSSDIATSQVPPNKQLQTPEPFPPLPPPDYNEHVAFCLVIKNQSLDMPEFLIHHYHHHGVRRFYIYDDGTVPPLSTHPYIDSYGIPESALHFLYIHPEDVLDRTPFQKEVYMDCVRRFGHLHKWMAFLDPDEFLEMRGPDPPTLLQWLRSWESEPDVGALGVHWLGHNSNGHRKRPEGDVRKAYTTCIGNGGKNSNRHIKTFVRTDRFAGIDNIHWAKTTKGTVEVSEGGSVINTWCHEPISHDVWALHHYATKSWEDYQLKKSRHRVEGGNLTDWWWDDMHNSGNVSCPEMAAYVP